MNITRSKRVGILVAASLLLACTVLVAAKRVDLVTGTVSARATDKYACILSNLGTTPINVEFTLHNVSAGGIAQTNTESVGPAETQGLSDISGGFFALCQFGFDGLPANVRANLLVTAADGEPLVALEAR